MGRKSSIIPKASAARMLMKAGAKRVSEDGAAALCEALTEYAMVISKKANEISKHAKRKTIHDTDIEMAAK